MSVRSSCTDRSTSIGTARPAVEVGHIWKEGSTILLLTTTGTDER